MTQNTKVGVVEIVLGERKSQSGGCRMTFHKGTYDARMEPMRRGEMNIAILVTISVAASASPVVIVRCCIAAKTCV